MVKKEDNFGTGNEETGSTLLFSTRAHFATSNKLTKLHILIFSFNYNNQLNDPIVRNNAINGSRFLKRYSQSESNPTFILKFLAKHIQ